MQPPEDREMPLEEHIAELRRRIIRISVVMLVGIGISFGFSGKLIDLFWKDVLPTEGIYVYAPTEWFMVQLTFAFVITLVVVYPYIVYELYQFAKPGLYENERRFVKTFLPFSYVLFLLGMGVAYFVVVPKLFSLATTFNLGALPYLSARRTVYLALKVMVAFGLIFQIPVLAVIAVRLGLVDSKWLKDKRWLVYVIVFILASNVTFDITGISQLVILALVVVMYELSIVLARIMERR